MKTKLLFSFLAVFFVSVFTAKVDAQTFTDPGGPDANYSNNTDYTVTFCPSNPGDVVTVTFTSFSTEVNWDALYVFDGNSTSAPQIASTNPAANVPGGLAGGFWGTTSPGPFTSTSPDGCLTFHFVSDTSVNYPGWVANVTYAPPPTCPKPTTLASSNITSTTANLTWTEAGTATAWEYIVLPAGSPAPLPATAGVPTTLSPTVLTGLTPYTCYTFYVRATCSATDISDWSIGGNFCTLLAAPDCGGTFVDNGGPNGNYANSSDNTYTICPDTPGDVVTVTFTSFYTEATWDALYVFDGNSIATPQIASTNPQGNVPGGLTGGFWGNLTGTALPGPFTATSPDGCLTFRFRSDPSVNNPGWIANVTCAPPPTCPNPTALHTFSITATSAVLSWTNNSTATQFEYILVTTGSPAPSSTDTGVSVSSSLVTVTGLIPETCYTFYVRAICSATDSSNWSVGANFCTTVLPPACGEQFVDNGGLNANYANSSDNTYTICPTTVGDIVTVVFSTFNTEATWDALYVFDGNSISAPQIASTNPAANVPGGLTGGYWGSDIPGPFTSTSPDGCLTFRFLSDPSVNNPGWSANVICAPDSDKIALVAFIDENNNGVKDLTESYFSGGSFIYQQNNDGIDIEGYSPSGRYLLYDANPSNTYNFSYAMQTEYTSFLSAGTTAYTNVSVAVGGGSQTLYFPITLAQVGQGYNDVSVTLVPFTPPRPGVSYINRIVYTNHGNAMTNGTLTFAKPSQVTINAISQTGTTANVSGFSYNFTNLLPNETRYIDVTLLVPTSPTVNVNDLLTDTATISGVANDINLVNNVSSNSQIVVNSFDPNNKMESHGDKLPINQFTQNDYFHYTIRFQNNGTASAIDVSLEDDLNTMIDETSVLMESASHSYVMNRVGTHLVWNFKNIYLPSSTVSAVGSMGYVEFKVKLKPGFHVGDIVPNHASIYFDTNPAIVTNTFNVKFIQALGISTFDSQSLVVYPNPAQTIVQINLIDSTDKISKVVLYDLLGKAVKTVNANSVDSLALDISNFARGVYLMEITSDTNLKLTKKLVIE